MPRLTVSRLLQFCKHSSESGGGGQVIKKMVGEGGSIYFMFLAHPHYLATGYSTETHVNT